jgi:hypothetical protein
MKELLESEANVGASRGRISNRSHPDWLKTMELGSLTHPWSLAKMRNFRKIVDCDFRTHQ